MKSIYKRMEDSPESAVWTQILRSSEMRMLVSRQTNSAVFEKMQQTQETIRRSIDTIRRTDDLIRRAMRISR